MTKVFAASLLVSVTASCLFDTGVPKRSQVLCSTSDDCYPGTACFRSSQGGRCVAPGTACVDVNLQLLTATAQADGIGCTLDDGQAGLCLAGTCAAPRCGDGFQQAGAEECDDGPDNSDLLPGACRRDCRTARCGDMVVDRGEECDDGNDALAPHCLDGCRLNVCGDRIVDPEFEECDEGPDNSDTARDACRSTCSLPSCGDGVHDTDEQCDDREDPYDAHCLPGCIANECGDGIPDPGFEQCDTGLANSDSEPNACRSDCRLPTCGDLVTDRGEQCDDGNDEQALHCLTGCVLNVCGDQVVDPGIEECDDNDLDDGDDCTNACAIARCGDLSLHRGDELCDDGNTDSGDGCRGDCRKVEVCGDGLPDMGEACDDGNANPADGCDRCRRSAWQIRVVTGAGLAADGAADLSLGDLALDAFGGLVLASDRHIVRFDIASAAFTHLAGDGRRQIAGDGGLAGSASLYRAAIVIPRPDGGLLFVDGQLGDVLRSIDGATRVISTVQTGIAVTAGASNRRGDVFVIIGNALQRIDAATGVRADFAVPFSGDVPNDVAVVGDVLYVATSQRIRYLSGTTWHERPGTYSRFAVAGDGTVVGVRNNRAYVIDGAGNEREIARNLAFGAGIAIDEQRQVWIASQRQLLRLDLGDPSPQAVVVLTGTPASTDGLAALSIQFPGGTPVVRGDGQPCTLLTIVDGSNVQHLVLSCVATDGTLQTVAELPHPGVNGDLDIDRAIDDPLSFVAVISNTGVNSPPPQLVARIAADGLVTPIKEFVGSRAGSSIAAAPDGRTIYLSRRNTIVPLDLVTGVVEEPIAGNGNPPDCSAAPPNGVDARNVALSPDHLDVADDGDILFTECNRVRRLHGFIVTTEIDTDAFVTGPVDLAVLDTGDIITVDQRNGSAVLGNGVVMHLRDGGSRQLARDGSIFCCVAGDGDPAATVFVGEPHRLALDKDSTFVLVAANGRVAYVDGAPVSEDLLWQYDLTTQQYVARIRWGAVDPPMAPFASASLESPTGLAVAPGPGARLLVAAGARERRPVGTMGSAGRLLLVDLDVPQTEVVAGNRFARPTSGLARIVAALGDLGGLAIGTGGTAAYLARRSEGLPAGSIERLDLVDPSSPTTWTLSREFSGGGAPAGIAVDPATGDLLAARPDQHCVVRIHSGVEQVVAGVCSLGGFFGDGGRAVDALLDAPYGVLVDRDGSLLIADTGNDRVRRVALDGTIDTLFADATGAPAPRALAMDARGDLLIAGRGTLTLLPVDDSGALDPRSAQTLLEPGATFPSSVVRCLSGAVFFDAATIYAIDECTGLLLELNMVLL